MKVVVGDSRDRVECVGEIDGELGQLGVVSVQMIFDHSEIECVKSSGPGLEPWGTSQERV